MGTTSTRVLFSKTATLGWIVTIALALAAGVASAKPVPIDPPLPRSRPTLDNLFNGSFTPFRWQGQEIAFGDFDHDGHVDLVLRNSYEMDVVHGRGDGTFDTDPATRIYPQSPGGLAVGDLNHDHKLDIVVTEDSTRVAFLLGVGADTFGAPVSMPAGNGAGPVVLSDLDRDGWPDIVIANVRDGTVSVFLNQSQGQFAAAMTFDVGDHPIAIAVGDVNGDGVADLVAANAVSGQSASVLLGAGDGSFGPRQTFPTLASPRSLAIGDLTGDGVPDIAVGYVRAFGPTIFSPSHVSILPGHGDGRFDPRIDLDIDDTGFGGGGPEKVMIADVNEDTRADLLVMRAGAAQLNVFIGGPSGLGTQSKGYVTLYDPADAALADVNEDRHIDVVACGFFGSAVGLGSGEGSFGDVVSSPAGPSPRDMAVGDFNGDGIADVAVLRIGRLPSIAILAGGGPAGTFVPLATFSTVFNPLGIKAGDMDGDGDLDLVVPSGFSNTVTVYRNNGHGLFSSGPGVHAGLYPLTIALADVNGDGKLDVIAGAYTSNDVSVLRNLGNAAFAAATIFVVGQGPMIQGVADMNGDGFTDVVLRTLSDLSGITIWHGHGDGTFGEPERFDTFTADASVSAIGDLNGDGLPDMAINRFGRIVTLLQLPGEGWGYGYAYLNSFASLEAGAIVDFDGDGWPDLVAPDYQTNVVAVFFGDKQGLFNRRQYIGSGWAPGPIAVADVDNDGAPDIVALCTSDETITTHRNRLFDIGRPLVGETPAVNAALQLLSVRAQPSNTDVPISLIESDLPSGSTSADLLFVLGKGVTAGPDGITGNSDDVDLRGTFEARADQTTVTGTLTSPSTILAHVPLDGARTMLTASVETSIAGTSRQARDIDRIELVVDGAAVTQSGPALTASAIPEALELAVAGPRSDGTRLRLGMPRSGWVKVELFDVDGRRTAVLFDGTAAAGWSDLRVPRDVRQGVYFVTARWAAERKTMRLVVVT